MAVHWQIPFRSLRANKLYTVNIYDSTYSGTPIVLKGGAEPFVTQESDDDDMFVPIRTQSGYVRIIDDGFAADGVTAFDWKELVPATDTDRPVLLTRTEGNSTYVEWIGYMQAQDFSGTLYGNPQEREYPVHCVVSGLSSVQLSTQELGFGNFAALLQYVINAMPKPAGESMFGINLIYVQGDADAQQWLLKVLDWQNFYDTQGEDIEARYNVYEVFEDMCRFWGWTARTQGQTLYLVRADDADEPTFFRMNLTQLATMASGSTSGQTGQTFIPVTLSGDVFASTSNTDTKLSGYSRASVNADVNDQDSVISFAPGSVRKVMDEGGYTWVDGEDENTGYFTTPLIREFETVTMKGSATQYGGFCRRQIYSDGQSDNSTKEDMFVFSTGYDYNSAVVSIQTKKAMSYTGGSLKIKGNIYVGAVPWNWSDENDWIRFRVGIGMTKQTAKWFNIATTASTIDHSWGNSTSPLISVVKGGRFDGVAATYSVVVVRITRQFPAIPCDDNLYGYLFFEFYGMDNDYHTTDHFEIGNFQVEFTREEIFFPSTTGQTRPRTMSEERLTSREYTAKNNNACSGEWNTDCIFASDNNMEYGYGLLINPGDGTFMTTVGYNGDLKHPEQQLADRVASYWATAKRAIDSELRTDAIGEITPRNIITIDNTTVYPVSISRDWRDDVTTLKMIEL